ncbi:MAG: lipoprotein-releasing ABC transporter permease subunit [Pseudomonadota bacterium]
MFQPYEFFIGLRYTRAKRRNHFISFISLISMLGIALGITALITVLSVMNGFEKEVRERILGMASHAEITRYQDPMHDWEKLANSADQHPLVVGAAPYVEGQVMVYKGQQVTGTLVRGVLPDEEPKVSDLADKMLQGSLTDLVPGEFNVVLGVELANFLNTEVGEKVTVVAPQATISPVGVLPTLKRFTVVGFFQVGMFEYDRSLMLFHAQDASKLLRLKGGMSGVRLKLTDMFESRSVARDLAVELGERYWVSDWTRKHSNYFRAVKTEKTVMFVILTLVVAVAAFNIVSTLVMVVTDKQSDIAILRTLGSSPRSILMIFLVQGAAIGVIGMILGLIGGISLAQNVETIVPAIENFFSTKFLDPSVYYISTIPSDMHWDDVIKIAGLSFALTLLATLYPALRASRTDPAEALRYE